MIARELGAVGTGGAGSGNVDGDRLGSGLKTEQQQGAGLVKSESQRAQSCLKNSHLAGFQRHFARRLRSSPRDSPPVSTVTLCSRRGWKGCIKANSNARTHHGRGGGGDEMLKVEEAGGNIRWAKRGRTN